MSVTQKDKGTIVSNHIPRKAINIGLLSCLGASMVALLFEKKALHAVSGFSFLGFGILHILRHKRLLWRS